jgi:hypothetical protein
VCPLNPWVLVVSFLVMPLRMPLDAGIAFEAVEGG